MAEEPSQVWLDTAAVIVPPSASGSSSAIFSMDVLRGVSSISTPLSGAISLLNRPSSIAANARVCDCSANSSICSRDIFHLSAIICADVNWEGGVAP